MREKAAMWATQNPKERLFFVVVEMLEFELEY